MLLTGDLSEVVIAGSFDSEAVKERASWVLRSEDEGLSGWLRLEWPEQLVNGPNAW